jgi:hypothetical protein
MLAGTSPSIAAQTSGSYEIAYQAGNGELSLYASESNAGSSSGQAMTSGTSPSIAALASGGYETAYQGPPSPSQPVVTTPVTVTVPSPSPTPVGHPGKHSQRRFKVKIAVTWTWVHAHSRLRHMRVSKLPAAASVTISCRGRGCPLRIRHADKRKLKRLVASVQGTIYRAGDHVYITVSAPGYLSERARFTIRNGALPTVRLL